VKTFEGPGDPTADSGSYYPRTSYIANYWSHNVSKYPTAMADGTSQTIAYAEAYAVATQWQGERFAFRDSYGDGRYGSSYWDPYAWGGSVVIAPAPNTQFNPFIPAGHAIGGVQVSLWDGSVRNVSAGVGTNTFYAACSPASGDVLGSDW